MECWYGCCELRKACGEVGVQDAHQASCAMVFPQGSYVAVTYGSWQVYCSIPLGVQAYLEHVEYHVQEWVQEARVVYMFVA